MFPLKGGWEDDFPFFLVVAAFGVHKNHPFTTGVIQLLKIGGMKLKPNM